MITLFFFYFFLEGNKIIQVSWEINGRELRTALTLKQIETEANETRNPIIKCAADRKEAHNKFSNKADMIKKKQPNWLNMIMVDGCSFQLLSIPKTIDSYKIWLWTSETSIIPHSVTRNISSLELGEFFFSDTVFRELASQIISL